MISQRTECSLDVSGDDMQIEITKKGIAYTFRFIGLPNPAKAPFVHNLTPLTDIFFLDLYDPYDYRGGVVIDIGGYIGDTAVYFAKNGAAEVYSYEPNPVNYEYLEKNINLNGVAARVKTINCAISIERRLLVVPDKAGAGSVYSNSDMGASYDVGNVKPNDLLHGLQEVSLLKVDCKGCERELLFGESMNEVSKKVKYLIIDAGRLNSEERDKMISELLRAGFSSDSGPSEALYFRNQRLPE
jgi:FkbM family methyltransferase